MSTSTAPLSGVALTSLWVAAVRARESERDDAWFRDPFARELAGEAGFAVADANRTEGGAEVPTMEIRTRWLDERINERMQRGAEPAIDQVVILAAGMDARAYRLASLADTTVFELDRDSVLAYKRDKLHGAAPIARRVEVPGDLRDDWPSALCAAGFDATTPSVFMVEGLLVYLEERDVRGLLDRIDALAAPGSMLLFDVVGRSLLDSPYMAPLLKRVADLGAPWWFGIDEPEALVSRSWTVHVRDFGEVGTEYGRWPFPRAPRGTPAVPQSFPNLVQASRVGRVSSA